jgi:myo-inositol 2-dehydrogenase / D-chiro-inositol 1-dehydrogenase
MTTRIGLVGAGFIAGRHLDALTSIEGVTVAGIADPRADRAEVLAARAGAAAYAHWADLLDVERLDALWVCVPPHAHGEVETAAVERRLPLFVEKPLAADLAVAELVADAVAASGLPTATGYHWRHLDTVDRARSALAGTAIRLVGARWWGTTPPPTWWSRQDRSGGQVVEQATHVLDLVRVLAGEVVEVVGGAAGSSAGARDVPDATAAVLRFDSGAVGTISTSCVLPVFTAAGLDVIGDGIAVQLDESALHIRTRDGDEHAEPAVDGRTAVDRAFVDVLSGGTAAAGLVDVAEALRTHRLAWAVSEAARTGAAVRVDGR